MPWDVVAKSLFILVVAVAALAPVVTWVERKQSAVMQDRIGANRADLFGIRVLGLLHPAAGCTTDMKCSHGQLGTRLADGLGRQDSDGLTDFHGPAV